MSGLAETPIVGFAAHSGSGKTSLIVKLLPMLTEQGIRPGVIKHAHHTFDIDHPGKDSYELRKAGASQMLIASKSRWALMVETESKSAPSIDDMVKKLDKETLDLIIVEGFKLAGIPKIEVYRPSLGKTPLFLGDPTYIAVATDAPDAVDTNLPVLDLNRPEMVTEFIVEQFPSLGQTTCPR